MILGSGIQILEGALAKALDEGVTTPTFIEELDVKVFGTLIKLNKTLDEIAHQILEGVAQSGENSKNRTRPEAR